MTTLSTIEIEPPCLLFIGDMDYELDAKTAFGIAHRRPELCMAQLRFGTTVDLGLPDIKSEDAVAAGARSLIVGVAPVGGTFPETWETAEAPKFGKFGVRVKGQSTALSLYSDPTSKKYEGVLSV